jgi:hypothetical protein
MIASPGSAWLEARGGEAEMAACQAKRRAVTGDGAFRAAAAHVLRLLGRRADPARPTPAHTARIAAKQ